MSDAAIVCIVTGFVTIATLWLKLKYGVERTGDELVKRATLVEQKVDANTKITIEGTDAAVTSAKAAAQVAAENRVATEQMSSSLQKKLNGGIDAAIESAVKPVQEVLIEHREKVAGLRSDFDKLNEYVHARNHDILTSLQILTNQVAILIARTDVKK